MDNIYDTDVGNLSEERRERADSPSSESPAEARQQLYSEVQVHAPAEEECDSPDYMEIKEADTHSCSSSSSSDDDEEEKVKKVAEQSVEVEVGVLVEPAVVEQVNGEVHDGSRRSSASSASSVSHGDPCDDQPIRPETLQEDKPEEYSLTTLENLTVDENSEAPADPDQPEISLFTKVRARGAGSPR